MIEFIKTKEEHIQTLFLTAIACITGVIPCICFSIISILLFNYLWLNISLSALGILALFSGIILTTIIENKIKIKEPA